MPGAFGLARQASSPASPPLRPLARPPRSKREGHRADVARVSLDELRGLDLQRVQVPKYGDTRSEIQKIHVPKYGE